MLDINMLRKQLPEVIARLKTRPFDFPEKEFNALENERKEVQTKTEELQALRNQLSQQIGIAKSKGEDAAQFMAEAAAIYQAQPGICFHVISFADTEEGQAVLDKIAGLNSCSVSVKGADLMADQNALNQFVADVFYTTGAAEEAQKRRRA